ncbi:unnamed protein product [Victoria cruziana]
MAGGASIGLFMIFSLLVVGIKAEHLQNGRSLKSILDPYRRLFVFGDSFADTGNDQNPDEPYYSIRKPYGMTYPLFPTGRWSDGKVMTDFVAEYMDIPSPIPYSKRNNTINKLLLKYGMNFAYGGTGVFDTFTGLPNMTQQIDDFEQLIKSGLYADHLSSSIALVSYAGNDYRVYLERGGTIAGLASIRQQVVQKLAANVRRLQNLGVKKVAVSNLQPVGCSPSVTYSISFSQCVSLFNDLSVLHNQLLDYALHAPVQAPSAAPQLPNPPVQAPSPSQSFPNPPAVILDNYNAFLAVLQQEKFGNRLKGCCMGVNISVWCGTVDNSGHRQYTLCPIPWSTFWWDNNHPSHFGWKAVVEYHQPTLDLLLN